MSQDRLNGLAVFNIHEHIPIDIDDVITRYSRWLDSKHFKSLLLYL